MAKTIQLDAVIKVMLDGGEKALAQLKKDLSGLSLSTDGKNLLDKGFTASIDNATNSITKLQKIADKGFLSGADLSNAQNQMELVNREIAKNGCCG